jgi:hypothetical protein
MKKLSEWRSQRNLEGFESRTLHRDDFVRMCLDYFGSTLRGDMKTIREFRDESLVQIAENSRYSVEVNYRTTADQAMEGFARICLGYVSAAMKKNGYHTRHVFEEKPLRLLVTARNWDDGSWTGCITYNPEHKCFVLSKGFFNKDRKTISIQKSEKCNGDSAAELTKNMVNAMHQLKDEPDRHMEKLKPVPLKRGPKS